MPPHAQIASSERRLRWVLLDQARQAWAERDYETAIESLTRARRSLPGDWSILISLGEAYGLRFDYAQADSFLEEAVRVASDKLQSLAQAGAACLRFNRPQMARSYFLRAADHPNAGPSVLARLAEIEESHSRKESALALLERALALDPADPATVVARARMHRLAGELEEGEKLLRSLLATAAGEPAVPLWYELGTNLDRQGKYDPAMAAFLQAKALRQHDSMCFAPELQKLHAGFREAEQSISAAMLKRWVAMRAEWQPARRFALLCGHPRSGTTLLEQVLDAHPGIIATDETSILLGEAYPRLSMGFSDNTTMVEILDAAPTDALQQARAEYFRLAELFCGERIGNRLLIDKNPALDVHIPMVARIFPEASFLIALRDPRDVCLSCFMLPLPVGRLSALYHSLETTAAQYVSVMGFSRAVRARLPSPQMEIRYEQIVVDLPGVSRQVLDFLGLPWDPAILGFDAHAQTRPLRCGIDDAVATPLFKSSVGRWRHYAKYLDPCLKQLEPFIKAFGYS